MQCRPVQDLSLVFVLMSKSPQSRNALVLGKGLITIGLTHLVIYTIIVLKYKMQVIYRLNVQSSPCLGPAVLCLLIIWSLYNVTPGFISPIFTPNQSVQMG